MSITGRKLLKYKHMEAKQQITEKIKREIKICHKWKWKHDNPKPMGFSKSSAKGKVHSSTSLTQETGEKSNK